MQSFHLFNQQTAHPLRSIIFFCFPIFFIFLADSIMSYNFPILVERTTGSNSMVGIIMALSSLLGICCDFAFPQLLQGRSWKLQLLAGIILSFLFPFSTHLGTAFGLFYFFVIATLVWGIYFEFLQFSQQSFVVNEESPQEYSKDWGLLFFIIGITIMIGPIVGSLLLKQPLPVSTFTIMSFQFLSLLCLGVLFVLIPNKGTIHHEATVKKTLHLFGELLVWEKLGERVWPAILMGIMVNFVNASYWTIGGLYGLNLLGDIGFDWIVISLFSVPMLLGSFLLTRIKIPAGKKKLSQLSLLVGGLLLANITFFSFSPILVLILIGISSFSLSFAGPLNESVYSDLLERSGKSKLHLLGIAKANASFAYIIAPLLTGFLADKTSYPVTFSIVGVIAFLIGLFLLMFSPKKIKLPLKGTLMTS